MWLSRYPLTVVSTVALVLAAANANAKLLYQEGDDYFVDTVCILNCHSGSKTSKRGQTFHCFSPLANGGRRWHYGTCPVIDTGGGSSGDGGDDTPTTGDSCPALGTEKANFRDTGITDISNAPSTQFCENGCMISAARSEFSFGSWRLYDLMYTGVGCGPSGPSDGSDDGNDGGSDSGSDSGSDDDSASPPPLTDSTEPLQCSQGTVTITFPSDPPDSYCYRGCEAQYFGPDYSSLNALNRFKYYISGDSCEVSTNTVNHDQGSASITPLEGTEDPVMPTISPPSITPPSTGGTTGGGSGSGTDSTPDTPTIAPEDPERPDDPVDEPPDTPPDNPDDNSNDDGEGYCNPRIDVCASNFEKAIDDLWSPLDELSSNMKNMLEAENSNLLKGDGMMANAEGQIDVIEGRGVELYEKAAEQGVSTIADRVSELTKGPEKFFSSIYNDNLKTVFSQSSCRPLVFRVDGNGGEYTCDDARFIREILSWAFWIMAAFHIYYVVYNAGKRS